MFLVTLNQVFKWQTRLGRFSVQRILLDSCGMNALIQKLYLCLRDAGNVVWMLNFSESRVNEARRGA